MKIGIIGRSELLFNSVTLLREAGHDIIGIVSCKAAPEMLVDENDFQELAKQLNAKFLYDPKISYESALDFFGDSCDLGVSINYSGIISKGVIDIFPYGILNLHGGDLPRYRGNACQAWAILNGEQRIGLCVHKMIGGELDSGMILQREYLNINIDTRIGQVYKWMASASPKLIVKAAEKLSSNPEYFLEKQSTNPSDILRTYPRKPEDGKIIWDDSNANVVRLVNASSEPFSGAFAFLNGEKIIIWRAELLEDNENYCAVPGQVTFIDRDDSQSIHVATGEGKILISLIGINEKKLPPGMVINSIRTRLN
jgi:UDP-4-amino-4-deoxy-L-arabinose formyltransferase/UDP-glucuronic acid dehydrogenase (UDP-4-keto-hexauronic acid decarboxylating)